MPYPYFPWRSARVLPTTARLLLGLALAASTLPAQAQAQTPADTLHRQALTGVEVTATRPTAERPKGPQQRQVISRRELELTPAQEPTDVLKKHTAVDVVQFPSLLAGVGIRGFRPQTSGLNQRTLLLVDGRPAGTANLATLDLNSAEQVEVLKGPASALYGPQAMGGVVNVHTRQSRGPVRTSLTAGYGSFRSYRFGATSGGNITKRLDFDLSLGYFRRAQDYTLGNGGVFRRWLDGGHATLTYADGSTARTDDARADGQRRVFTQLGYYTGALRLGYQLSDNWRVDVRGEQFAAHDVQSPADIATGNLSGSTKRIDRRGLDLSATGSYARHQLLVRGYASRESNANNTLFNSSSAPITPYRSLENPLRWRGLQLRDVIKLGRQALTVGASYNEARSTSQRFTAAGANLAPLSPNYELRTTAVYAQSQLNMWADRVVLTPGARVDVITYRMLATELLNTFTPGQHTYPFFSPSLGAQAELLTGLRAHATLGRGFITPDAAHIAGFTQVLSATGTPRTTALVQGNPALRNETSLSWDAGLRFDRPAAGFAADLTYFATRVRHRITTRTTNPVGETTPEGLLVRSRTTYLNADDSRIQGLEAEASYDFGALAGHRYVLQAFIGGTRNFRFADVVNNADGTQSTRPVFNVARLSGNYGVAFDSRHGLRARLAGHYAGPRADNDFTDTRAPQVDYPAYLTLDFAAAYTLATRHTLTLQVANLTDENYYEKRGFNLPGRSWTGGYAIAF
ncbi:TonB-dependent receptor [Hymenobacter sp. ASUV-10]|uniref:TonB-dependent receptor n=1 Tax=Hymenobacter aranciens TaxID=3063996 RepID=A0ABT9B5H6_9BACT|nr:TonB-dependent receptor [Hymenobacter sp. ASUV-10]MDO7873510.1 TonB-dependent receptor [Hymenobacter sp. ASUV-10]